MSTDQQERKRPKTTHVLRTWPKYFDSILDGSKTFELRDNSDRDFRVGDRLRLVEWSDGEYTGRSLDVEISYVLDLSTSEFVQVEGWAVLGFANPALRSTPAEPLEECVHCAARRIGKTPMAGVEPFAIRHGPRGRVDQVGDMKLNDDPPPRRQPQEHFGHLFRDMRVEWGIPLRAMAKSLGISTTWLGEFERYGEVRGASPPPQQEPEAGEQRRYGGEKHGEVMTFVEAKGGRAIILRKSGARDSVPLNFWISCPLIRAPEVQGG